MLRSQLGPMPAGPGPYVWPRFPVGTNACRAWSVCVAEIDDMLLVDLWVTASAGGFGDPANAGGDFRMIGSMAIGAGKDLLGMVDRRVLYPRSPHRAPLELSNDRRLIAQMTFRAATRGELTRGRFQTDARSGWWQVSEIVVNKLRLVVCHYLFRECMRDGFGSAKLRQEPAERPLSLGKGRHAAAAAGARAVTSETALGDVKALSLIFTCLRMGFSKSKSDHASEQDGYDPGFHIRRDTNHMKSSMNHLI